jgi:ribonuclease P protein component
MLGSTAFTLPKEERVSSKRQIDELFTGSNSRSIAAFPLRLVYRQVERQPDSPQAQILVTVSKRYFKRAVKRNRVKRQIREAYRKNKHLLPQQEGKGVVIAFIWLDNHLRSSEVVEQKVVKLLQGLAERWQEKGNEIQRL